ncbi:hypothetical protein K493DRAFT_336240 [Basidiobolus meristosporus CBS 931.73]|uniref:Uncharacterized protein n=1 Tax=Basidiobolus meristosporus CBS 931.73 TaxID=1314790 RepID=A0A1Y1YJP9_9FUNG|nr:hypothetical protein K493DRAFT_336240 [Basidiobolus meristosporus CBS 931.73]|eukprot:ORX98198.1 hypothetical protein K493DRAFT_336240 [Basidiobolus meristosporus CBS 931.73]
MQDRSALKILHRHPQPRILLALVTSLRPMPSPVISALLAAMYRPPVRPLKMILFPLRSRLTTPLTQRILNQLPAHLNVRMGNTSAPGRIHRSFSGAIPGHGYRTHALMEQFVRLFRMEGLHVTGLIQVIRWRNDLIAYMCIKAHEVTSISISIGDFQIQ